MTYFSPILVQYSLHVVTTLDLAGSEGVDEQEISSLSASLKQHMLRSLLSFQHCLHLHMHIHAHVT